MSEIKHTPGPWILETVPTSVGSCHKIGPFSGAGHRPYTFACVYADGIRVGIDEALPAAVELAANARLIAAAPDLLEVCRGALDSLEYVQENFPDLVGCGVRDSRIKHLKNVIAKATGA